MVERLIEQLRDSGFGRPRPRHGLKLLYWFANECISFENDNEMHCECDPANGDFGFHRFKNRYNKYGEKLLPDVNIPYYVVGNLNSPGACQLPLYVSEDYSTNRNDRNTDRLIVSMEYDEWIERVYVTQHMDSSNYDPDATIQIPTRLLIIIKSMNLEDFLWKTGYSTWPPVCEIPFNYNRPVTPTSNVAVVSPASPLPALQESDEETPPSAQIDETTIQIEPDINTHKTNLSESLEDFLWKMGYSTQPPVCKIPFSYNRPVTPTSNAAVVSPASPPPAQQESDEESPPSAQIDETIIQIEPDINKHKTRVSENVPIKGKRCWNMCAIL